MGYADDLSAELDAFEKALVERWYQTIYDAVREMEPLPYPLHLYMANTTGSYELVPEHRSAETFGHISLGAQHGACPFLTWYEAGCNGSAKDVTCDGVIWKPGDWRTTVIWEGLEVEVPKSTDCRIAALFRYVEDWAYNDRKYIYDSLPPFEDHRMGPLEEARNGLVEMAADFGGKPSGENKHDEAFQSELTLENEVQMLFGDRNKEVHWREDWTGTVSDLVHGGIFASTMPTLINHALLANGLSVLVNERAMIVHTYRKNILGLIGGATKALGEKSEGTTDLTGGWKVVQGIGMTASIVPQAAPVGAAITLVGWLGEQFVKDIKSTSFTHGPHDVAVGLYEEVQRMKEALQNSEDSYADDVSKFREALNEVPSTFLELYDLTENKAEQM